MVWADFSAIQQTHDPNDSCDTILSMQTQRIPSISGIENQVHMFGKPKATSDIVIAMEEFPDDISDLDDIENFFPDDMFPASCKSDHMTTYTQNDALEKFLMRTEVNQTPLPHSPDHYSGSPTERVGMGVEGYSPLGNGHTEPLSSQWENVHVRNTNLQGCTPNLMNTDMQHSHLQQQHVAACGVLSQGGAIQSAQAHSYIPIVKQEVEQYDQTLYSSYMESSLSEGGFPTGCDQKTSGPDEGVRKERRREQNRRAARKCREKKKRQQDSVVKSFEELRKENNDMKEEVDRLNRQLAELAEGLRTHQSACPYAKTLPKIAALQSKICAHAQNTRGLGQYHNKG